MKPTILIAPLAILLAKQTVHGFGFSPSHNFLSERTFLSENSGGSSSSCLKVDGSRREFLTSVASGVFVGSFVGSANALDMDAFINDTVSLCFFL